MFLHQLWFKCPATERLFNETPLLQEFHWCQTANKTTLWRIKVFFTWVLCLKLWLITSEEETGRKQAAPHTELTNDEQQMWNNIWSPFGWMLVHHIVVFHVYARWV